jgi:tetratricopeptide (TPR) repeat protein
VIATSVTPKPAEGALLAEGTRPEIRAYDELRARAEATFHEGQTVRAYELFDQALTCAQELGDPIRVDRAVCSRAAVRVILGETLEVVPELRSVLNHHADLENSRLAAYNLSMAYEQKKDFKKGVFYARTAVNYSRLLERQKWIASSLNQLGNCLLGESLFEEAIRCFDEALTLLPEPHGFYHWAILENLGYAETSLGNARKGAKILLRALRGLKTEDAVENVMVAHADLSYTYLELKRPRWALKHAVRALRMAEAQGYEAVRRNALYLLGQSCQEIGDSGRAAGFFVRLQQEFFPSSPEISQFLMAVDVRGMINLRA